MSQRRRIEVEITGNPRGFEAALNRINAGLSRTTRGMHGMNREMGVLQRQILAVGTTARYALAGQLVFGITGAIQRLGEFNSALGETASLAGSITAQGNFKSIGNEILTVGDDAIRAANKYGIAVDSIQQYQSRFASAGFNVAGGARGQTRAMREFVQEMAALQMMMGREAGDPQALAGGVAGMIRSIPGGQKNIGSTTKRLANIIAYVTAESPVITGTDIARDIGRLTAAQTAMGMTPEEVFAVYGLASASGGSGAVIGRGIAQLLGSEIMRPQTPDQIQAFQMAGLPTTAQGLRNFSRGGKTGGIAVLNQMMSAVGAGTIANPSVLGNESLSDEEALRAAGVKGMNMNLASALFGRQESFRQFLNLIANGGVPALEKFIDGMDKAQESNLARQREDEAQRFRMMTRFQVARQNLGLSLVRGAQWPLENMVARPTIAGADFLNEHRTTTQVGVGGVLAAGAVAALNRITGGRVLGRVGRMAGRITGVTRELASNALQAEATPAVLAGGETSGTRADPFWVIVHPYSWSVGTPGGGLGGGGGIGTPPVVPFGAGKWALRGGLGAALVTSPLWVREIQDWQMGKAMDSGHAREVRGNSPLLKSFATPRGFGIKKGRSDAEQDIIGAFNSGKIGEARAENLLRALARADGKVGNVAFAPNGKMDVVVKMVDDKGNVIATQEKSGVPVKWWGANAKFPTAAGQPGSRRNR